MLLRGWVTMEVTHYEHGGGVSAASHEYGQHRGDRKQIGGPARRAG